MSDTIENVAVPVSGVVTAKSVSKPRPKKTVVVTDAADKRVPSRGRKAGPDLASFRVFLGNLGMAATPTVHVNGLAHSSVVMVVDFGVPFDQPKMTPEQQAELTSKMKAVVAELALPKVVSVRVHSDLVNGVWWCAIG